MPDPSHESGALPRHQSGEPQAEQSGEDDARRVTFHIVPVRDGDHIYVQPNEQVMHVEYDPNGARFFAILMATHDGPPDGGLRGDEEGWGGTA